MYKLLLSLILSILTLSVSAQRIENDGNVPKGNSKEDKLFREAFLKGRGNKEFYVIVNESNKVIKLDDLVNYCESHNYIWNKNYTTKQIKRFGDLSTSIQKFYFIPKDEYLKFIFEWTNRTTYNSSDLKKQGSVYFFNADENRFICLYKECLWSGSIDENGYVSGFGVGFWKKNDHTIYYFQGTFQNGFPLGKAVYRIVNTKSSDGWALSPRDKTDSGGFGVGSPFRMVEMGEFSDGMALFRYLDNGEGNTPRINNKYGYVGIDGNVAIKPSYETAYAFSGGRAHVLNDKKENIYINKNGQFLDYTESQKVLNAEKERQELLAKQKQEEERRIAEAKEAERRAEDLAMKKNSEGKQITWSETMTYDTGSGSLGEALLDAFGGSVLHQEKYIVVYTGIVEKVIGDESVKCIIKRAEIQDPRFASTNYLKYRKYVQAEVSEALGKTRVLDMDEFILK